MEHGPGLEWPNLRWRGWSSGQVLSAHTHCCPGGLCTRGTCTSEILPSTETIAGFFSRVTEIHFQ